ncbi:MAG: peptide MFS transporter [Planctomycetaceae bacterium]
MSTPESIAAEVVPAAAREGHPNGLWVLFITEMWERFSYYGMRALLVLYLIRSTATTLENGQPNTNPGFGWSEESAYYLYALYTWAVYLLPLAGGWIADRFLGTHRSMVLGGIIIAAGHITLAMTEMFGITAGEAVTLQHGAGALLCFMTGLVLIIIGTGFFKPCVSVMVGQLYERDDPRKDSGFTIFYMGINLGAFFSPIVAGTLGEKVGWHWGFGSAAVGMIAGLVFYVLFRPKYLGHIGELAPRLPATATQSSVTVEHPRMTATDWQRVGVIVILSFLGNLPFWMSFEQAGSSLNVFAEQKTQRTLGFMSGEFPATWYQAVNPLMVISFAPVFAILWMWLDKRKLNPPTPMKFALAQFLLGIAFLVMVAGALEARNGKLAGPHWLLITYIVATWGELSLSPVGLSMVTKLAPPHRQSLLMGIWFFGMSFSNLLSGVAAALSVRLEKGEATFIFPGLPGFFLALALVLFGAGIVLMLLTPLLKRMMHGVH